MDIIVPRSFYCLVLSVALCGISLAQVSEQAMVEQQTEEDTEDLEAILDQAKSFVKAFNKGDAKAIAALWAPEGEYIDDAGQRHVGHDAIENCYAELFSSNSNVKIQVMVDSMRMLGDNVAIEDGRASIDPAPAGAAGFSKYTAVHIKVDGKWRMASVRDTWVEAPANQKNVADLDWLIGTWFAEEHGVKMKSVFRWIANNNFVERRYTVTHLDGTQTSGVQMIGWNPQGGHVQSWNFSPDGGYAVGKWTPHQGGWTAEMRGITGDGIPTTSVNLLTRLDDNAYVWQSVQRTAANVALPDTDEVILKRKAARQKNSTSQNASTNGAK